MRCCGLGWNELGCARLGSVGLAWIIWARLSWAGFGSTKLVSAELGLNSAEMGSGGLVLALLDWARLKRARLGWAYLCLAELNYAGLERAGLGWNGLG